MTCAVSLFTVVYCCICTGQRAISGGGDGVVNVWDLETGNVTAALTGHTQEVVSYSTVITMLYVYVILIKHLEIKLARIVESI